MQPILIRGPGFVKVAPVHLNLGGPGPVIVSLLMTPIRFQMYLNKLR